MLLRSAFQGAIQLAKDLVSLASRPRLIGSPGYDAAAAYIQRKLQVLPGVEVRVHEYDVMMPVTEHAALSMPGGGEAPVYPLSRGNVRLNTTPAEGIKGRLVYIGDAALANIRPGELSGQIAVIEAAAAAAWQQAAYFVSAIIVLGEDNLSNSDLRTHELLLAVNIPRFFLPQGPLADQIRRRQVTIPVTLRAAANWQTRRVRNIGCAIRARSGGSSAGAAGGNLYSGDPAAATSPNPAAVLSVPFDSMSMVPDLAYGASQAVQAAVGLAMVRICLRGRSVGRCWCSLVEATASSSWPPVR